MIIIIIIDIMPSTSRRPDSHCVSENDCVHYCIPGPIDNWTVLLLLL